MSTGAAWPNVANTALWHLTYKINTDQRGFNMGFQVADKTEVVARAVGSDLGKRIIAMLPPDAEIFYASMSRDDHLKDSRFLPDAIGPGTYAPTGGVVVPEVYDFPRTAWLFRLESDDGTSVTRKLAPLPDDMVEGGELTTPPTNVVGAPVALPALPAVGDLWNVIANNFMKAIVFQTAHVLKGHAAGGVYTYFPWVNAYSLRVGSKKGGRVFI